MAKIHIVDDEPRIRELIRENLQYSGYTDRKSTRLNSSHKVQARMPSSA